MSNQLQYKGPCIKLKLHKMLHAQNEVERERERGRGRAGAHTLLTQGCIVVLPS